jgi:feruloyl-CoA synthase
MPAAPAKTVPFTAVNLAPKSLAVEARADGAVVLRSTIPLAAFPRHAGEVLRRRAAAHPARAFLAEREAAGAWRTLTYEAARQGADAVAAWLLERGFDAARPIAILSDNSINFALLKLGAMQAGIPVMPVSPAYSLMSSDFAKIRYIAETFDPALVYVDRLAPFAKALAALGTTGRVVVADAPTGEVPGAIAFAELLAARPGPAVEAAFAAVGADTVGKILLTSGSTGMPKGVINTQRMMWSSIQAVSQIWPFLLDRPPVAVDWLPWNHTFGGNFNFNQTLFAGGTLYIDSGRPLPGRIETTVANLAEVRQTVLFNVPRAYDMLLPFFERDEALNRHVFGDLDMIFYAGAGMPQGTWDRLEACAVRARGRRVPILTSLGSTETAPPAVMAHWTSDVTGTVGLPLPGVEAKIVPAGDKLEVRFKGPIITPGYVKDEEKTRAAFDEEGYFRIGDAVKPLVPGDWHSGLVFDGRVAENFKLSTGTWVAAGVLRLNLLSAMQGLIQDGAVTGHDRDAVGLLAFPAWPACKAAIGPEAEALAPEAMARHAKLKAALAEKLRAYNAAHPGSSTRVVRMLLMTEPPNIDAGEITDKGYLNQRAILVRRAALVERLYADPPGEDVVVG